MSDVGSWTLKQTTGDPVTKLVLIAVGKFANWETGKCFPSIERISEVCEAHPNTVRRHLHVLEKKGIISLQKRNGTSYLITLIGYEEWHKTLPDKGATSKVGLHEKEGYSKSAPHLPQESTPPTCEVGKLNNLTNNLTTKLLNGDEDSSTTNLGSQKLDLKHLETVLLQEAGPCLDNEVNCSGLLNLSVPLMWLSQGADLHLDILPTLRAFAVKYRGKKKIRTWDYFTEAIAQCKATREAGLPQPSAEKSERSFRPSARNYKSKNELMEEALANLGKEEAKL